MTTAYQETVSRGEFHLSSWLHSSPIPDSLKTISVDVFEKILAIAAQTISDFQQTDLQEKIQVVLAQQESQSEKKIKTLLAKKDDELESLRKSTDILIQKLRGELEVASHVSDSLNAKLKTIESDSQKKFQQELKHLREEKESQYEREITRLQSQNKEFVSLLQSSLEKQYSERLKTEHEILAKSWAKLEEERLRFRHRGHVAPLSLARRVKNGLIHWSQQKPLGVHWSIRLKLHMPPTALERLESVLFFLKLRIILILFPQRSLRNLRATWKKTTTTHLVFSSPEILESLE